MSRSRSFSISPAAAADLVDIHSYVAKENPAAADRLINAIGAKIDFISESGLTGAPRDYLGKGLRAVLYGKYGIYFAVSDDHITIVRIMHGARNVDPEDFVRLDN